MPTQRPFLSNFLAAFRAHPHPQPLTKATTTGTGTTTTAAISTSTTPTPAQTYWNSTQTTQPPNPATTDPASSVPRPIHQNSKAAPPQPQPQPPHPQPSLLAQSPNQPLTHNVTPNTHLPRSPPTPPPAPTYPTPQEAHSGSRRRSRRGSDSSDSSGGFRAAGSLAGGEKWWIGGRTREGEERFYALTMVRRERSSDRVSADRLSL